MWNPGQTCIGRRGTGPHRDQNAKRSDDARDHRPCLGKAKRCADSARRCWVPHTAGRFVAVRHGWRLPVSNHRPFGTWGPTYWLMIVVVQVGVLQAVTVQGFPRADRRSRWRGRRGRCHWRARRWRRRRGGIRETRILELRAVTHAERTASDARLESCQRASVEAARVLARATHGHLTG